MADFYLKSGAGAIVYANRVWALGEKMVPALADAGANVGIARRWVWEVTTAGTSTATPTWPASVVQDTTTVTQNGVVWTARKPGFSNGATPDWSFATIFMHYAYLAMAAGDRLFVSNNHLEAQSIASMVAVFPGTKVNPSLVLCVDDSAAPPVALATTAVVSVTGNMIIHLLGSFFAYGITFQMGVGGSASLAFSIGFGDSSAGTIAHYKDCNFYNLCPTGGSSMIVLNNNPSAQGCKVIWENCRVKFAIAAIDIGVVYGDFHWKGGGIAAGGVAQTTQLIRGAAPVPSQNILLEGLDLTGIGTSCALFNVTSQSASRAKIRDSKLPVAWSGNLVSGTISGHTRVEMSNCDSADTNYRLWHEPYTGSIKHETTIVRTGGASDGTTPIAWKMVSNANAKYPLTPLESPEIEIFVPTAGAPITVKLHVVHDSQGTGVGGRLKNDEAWIEVLEPGTAGSPQSVLVDSKKANPLIAGVDCADSAEVFTTTGMATPRVQELSVTYTPQRVGVHHIKGIIAIASKTVYVCPEPTGVGFVSGRQWMVPGGTYINEGAGGGGGVVATPSYAS